MNPPDENAVEEALRIKESGKAEEVVVVSIGDEKTQETIKTLWECCQIPNFSKKTYGNHTGVVKKVFEFLTSKSG